MLRLVLNSMVLYLAWPGGTHGAPQESNTNKLRGPLSLLSGDGSISADFGLPDEHLAMVKRQELLLCDFDFEDHEPVEGIDGERPITDEEVLVTPERVSIAEQAERVSVQEFEEAAARGVLKIPNSWVQNGIDSFAKAREKLGYKRLEATSRELTSDLGGKGISGLKAVKVAGGAAAAVAWVGGIVSSFVRNTTALDKAAAFLVVIPFVGCAVNTAAEVEKGDDKNFDLVVLDSVLCGVADALLFGPLLPFGLGIHFVRAVMSFFRRPPNAPTLEQLRQRRDDSWDQQLEFIYQNIYSHPYLYPTQEFATKMESAFAIDTLSVLSESAKIIGVLNATSSADLVPSSDPDLDLDEVQVKTEQAIYKIKQDRWDVVARRQREYLFGILDQFTHGTAFQLTELAKAVNEKFIKHINAEEFIENYRDQSRFEEWIDSVTTESLRPIDRFSIARAQMKEAGVQLAKSPPALPRALNVAFIIGQSKGIDYAQKDTVSLFNYFEVEMAEASTEGIPGLYRFYTMVRHTHQTVLFLQGSLKEEDLDNSIWPVEDLDTLHKFRLLAAMRLGKLYEEAKIEYLDEEYRTNKYILSPTAPPIIVNPSIPPLPEHPDPAYLISLAIGLVDAVSSDDFNDEVLQYLKTRTSDIRLKNWQALQERIRAIKKKLDELAAEEYRGAPVSSDEFMTRHLQTCVDLGSDEGGCKYIVGGCYYSQNTTDEFASECIHEAFQPVDQARRTIQTQYREACDMFPSRQACMAALSKCAKANPKTRVKVLFTCTAKAAPKPDDSDTAAAPESTG
ncbi:hypothetical protein MHUMG1_09611 [Metarhizium humberi]|uniref:Heat-labile enterotoxin, A chain n=1 Tax=Metarhizium humberi TaxID=2596975 RepID=A0A9P8S2N9_9HYPO|nr:hypothetical protein MHUMG1_09611 [Metarhizium humberi]